MNLEFECVLGFQLDPSYFSASVTEQALVLQKDYPGKDLLIKTQYHSALDQRIQRNLDYHLTSRPHLGNGAILIADRQGRVIAKTGGKSNPFLILNGKQYRGFHGSKNSLDRTKQDRQLGSVAKIWPHVTAYSRGANPSDKISCKEVKRKGWHIPGACPIITVKEEVPFKRVKKTVIPGKKYIDEDGNEQQEKDRVIETKEPGVEIVEVKRPAENVTLEEALVKSINASTIHLGNSLGRKNVALTAEGLGFAKAQLEPENPAFLLGTANTDLFDIATMMTTLANSCEFTSVKEIDQIFDITNCNKGLTCNDKKIAAKVQSKKDKGVSRYAARRMREVMRKVVTQGTGRGAHVPRYGYTVWGKTGTTDNGKDLLWTMVVENRACDVRIVVIRLGHDDWKKATNDWSSQAVYVGRLVLSSLKQTGF